MKTVKHARGNTKLGAHAFKSRVALCEGKYATDMEMPTGISTKFFSTISQ